MFCSIHPIILCFKYKFYFQCCIPINNQQFKTWQRPVGTIFWMGEGEIKENDGGGEFKYDIFDILPL
jgi:hypothetical protein